MCNLYNITTNQAAIIALFRVVNRYVARPGFGHRREPHRSRRREAFLAAIGNLEQRRASGRVARSRRGVAYFWSWLALPFGIDLQTVSALRAPTHSSEPPMPINDTSVRCVGPSLVSLAHPTVGEPF
jgi:hypothetical protein